MITKRKGRSQDKGPDSENPYWVSFSDIMAGLLVIFILALVSLMLQQKLKTEELTKAIIDTEESEKRAKDAKLRAMAASKRAKKSQQAAEKAELMLKGETDKNKNLRQEIVSGVKMLSEIEKIRIAIITEIAQELKRRGVKVVVSENSSAFHIPEETLSFETAKWDIPEGNKNGLRLIGNILHATITKKDRLKFIDTIFVEGHTDSVPLQRTMGNWGLSTYRAISVWNYWEAQDTAAKLLSQLGNHEENPVFSVSGYGDTRRLIQNDLTESDRRKNRRIDIRFTMKSLDRGDLEDLINRFSH